MSKHLRYNLFISATLSALHPEAAHAYVDPGSAGFIITTILGALAAAGYVIRSYFYHLKRLIFGPPENETVNGDSEVAMKKEDDSPPKR